MPEFQETVEEIRAEEATVSKLFDGDQKVGDRRRTPQYMEQLVAATDLLESALNSRRGMFHLQEAMSTSDFPLLLSDILDRQLLGSYQEVAPVWQNYIKRTVVPNFRNVERYAVDGAEGPLPEVGQLEEYPEGELQEAKDEFKVRKYGKRLDLSWETLIDDDLDAFSNLPSRLAKGARRTEQRAATNLYVDATGPHASLYTGGFNNIVPGNPELSIDGLTAALTHLSTYRDEDDEPIDFSMVHLVVPPALEVPALQIMNATEIEIDNSSEQRMRTANWMKNRLRLHVDPYIPVVATGAEGNASWFLFADPNSGRPAVTLGFLRGHETPALYERAPNARRVGGGEVMESFEDDSRAWRVRHVLGGGRLTNTGGAKATVASDGSGS